MRTLLPMALVVAPRAQGAQVVEGQLEVWVGGAWMDVVDPGLALGADADAADGAAPAITPKRHQAQGSPAGGVVEADSSHATAEYKSMG